MRDKPPSIVFSLHLSKNYSYIRLPRDRASNLDMWMLGNLSFPELVPTDPELLMPVDRTWMRNLSMLDI
jgi:hypothetical protein